MNVAIQVFAYDEPGLYDTLDAYAEQPVPEGVSIEYHAAVTPADGRGVVSGMLAEMAQHAIDHPTFEYVETPAGKLSSRNHAHDLAIDRGADVIVATDADAPPLDGDTLARIVEPFYDPDVVGANGMPISPITPIGVVTNVAAAVEERVRPHMNGQLHAFSAEGWSTAGPFDDSIDQTEIGPVRLEEEFRFRRRLEQTGLVVDTHARVRNDIRRSQCRLRLRNDDFCRRVRDSDTTFNPQ